jgi:hypothetical protein
MLDKVDSFAPTQIVGQFAADKILVQRIEVLAHSVFSFTNNSKLE